MVCHHRATGAVQGGTGRLTLHLIGRNAARPVPTAACLQLGEEELRVAHVRVRPIVLLIVRALLFGLLAMPATAAPHRSSA